MDTHDARPLSQQFAEMNLDSMNQKLMEGELQERIATHAPRRSQTSSYQSSGMAKPLFPSPFSFHRKHISGKTIDTVAHHNPIYKAPQQLLLCYVYGEIKHNNSRSRPENLPRPDTWSRKQKTLRSSALAPATNKNGFYP